MLTGQAGGATSTTSLAITVESVTFSAIVINLSANDISVPIGGTQRIGVTASVFAVPEFDIALSASGLPPGLTASFSPATVLPNGSSILTLTAASTAPVTQNTFMTVTGTPASGAMKASTSVVLSVSPQPGTLANNRTDYVSTEGSPFSAVYDSTHGLIFSSNPAWNRVDVISASTHAIQAQVAIRNPRGVAIVQDNSKVWVAAQSQLMYEIDTTTLAVSLHALPKFVPPAQTVASSWEGRNVFALADGTLLLHFEQTTGDGSNLLGIWDPVANTLTPFVHPAFISPGVITKSGNGKRIYSISDDSGGKSFFYDVLTKTFSPTITLSGFAVNATANVDATRVAITADGGPAMYDGNLNLLGALPGGGVLGIEGLAFYQGGTIFSSDNQFLYEVCMPAFTPFIYKINPNSMQTISISPAMPMIPVSTELAPPFFMPEPFGVDSTGMVFGVEDFGIAFDDGAFPQNYVNNQPGTPIFLQHMSPYTGPLAGGTTSGGFGNGFFVPPDVWYGATRGTANLSGTTLTITSPASTAPGPVNLKYLFPDGIEVFSPMFFSYGPKIQYAISSGASSSGGATGQIAVFGAASDNSNGTMTVGGATAPMVPTPRGQTSATAEPFPSTALSFTVPPGNPGWADISLTTSSGKSTLPKSFFYAQSVTDFPSPDTFTAVLYDSTRQQLYLSAGDHIDVFSLGSMHFVSPLSLPALGNTKKFAGLALSTDGSLLLAADLPDGSMAAVNPDNPSSSFVAPIAPPTTGNIGCTNGPMYVAAGSGNSAFVVIGELPGPGCPLGGGLFKVDLTLKTATAYQVPQPCSGGGAAISSMRDGSKIAISGGNFCILSVAQNTAQGATFNQGTDSAISGDGNVAASAFIFTDSAGSEIGRIAQPGVFFNDFGAGLTQDFNLQLRPQMNDSGSLYFLPYQNTFDIVDVMHATVKMRFALSETITNTALPMAIDAGGRRVFLLTNKGLTIVDLGVAPLAIGSLSLTTASSGSQITVRGSGFASTTTGAINGAPAAVSFTDENTISLTIPATSAGPATIVLTNADGTQYTLANVLVVQ